MHRVIVCGGRDVADPDDVADYLDEVFYGRGWTTEPDEYGNCLPDVTIISGHAIGADKFGEDYATVNWTGLQIFPADWKKYGRRAGPIRNQQMLDEGKPDLVIAFPTKNSTGTWDMVRRAKKANIEVLIKEV